MAIKITTASKSRHRATAAEKRQFGGDIVTVYYVQRHDTDAVITVEGYGKTQHDRRRYAIEGAKKVWGIE